MGRRRHAGSKHWGWISQPDFALPESEPISSFGRPVTGTCNLPRRLLVTIRPSLSWHMGSNDRSMYPAETHTRILSSVSRAIASVVSGLRCGYPVCCVFNYSLDSLLGIPSGLSRGEVVTSKTGAYVPCYFHKRVKKSLSRSECVQLLKTGCLVEHLPPHSTIQTLVDGRVISSTRIPDGMSGVLRQQLRLDSA